MRTALVIVTGVAIALGLTVALAYSQGDDKSDRSAASDNTYVDPLIAEGYSVTSKKIYVSGNAGRKITNIRWERATAPEVIILSDDTSAKAGDFTINIITFTGSDGKGNLDCQPNWGDKSSIATLIADAEKVRTAVQNGTAIEVADMFPYAGEHVGCMR
jgi:hypothetical protein